MIRSRDFTGDLPQDFPCGLRVLLVDGADASGCNLKDNIAELKYSVTSCSSWSDACKKMDDPTNSFDVVLAEADALKLKGKASVDLQKLLVPVVVMSTKSQHDDILDAINAGAADFIQRPVSKSKLSTIWQHAVRKSFNKTSSSDAPNSPKADVANKKRKLEVPSSPTCVLDAPESPTTPTSSDEFAAAKPKDIKDSAKSTETPRKKAKVDWTPALHQCFVDAVEKLGAEKAIPSRILELMGDSSKNLTRHHIASHLQKYRAANKSRMEGAKASTPPSWMPHTPPMVMSRRPYPMGPVMAGNMHVMGRPVYGRPQFSMMGQPPIICPPFCSMVPFYMDPSVPLGAAAQSAAASLPVMPSPPPALVQSSLREALDNQFEPKPLSLTLENEGSILADLEAEGFQVEYPSGDLDGSDLFEDLDLGEPEVSGMVAELEVSVSC